MHHLIQIFSIGLIAIHANAAEKPNFLIIAVDDLRTELNCYGESELITPHIDALAESGIRFDRAYCQQALCAPSRASVMSGTLPISNGIDARNSTNDEFQEETLTRLTTFPEYLKDHGYNTASIGKIFHNYNSEDKDAWTEQRWPKGKGYQLEVNREKERVFQEGRKKGIKAWKLERGTATESADVPDKRYQDYGVATGAIDLMKKYSAKEEPFLLAVGFYKPHFPFTAPQKYWDLYDRDCIEVPSRKHPDGVAPFTLVDSWYETRQYGDIPKHAKNLSDEKTKELIHGYRACVSFVDAQIGRVMKALKNQGLDKNTYIILWSDHGFKLGNYGDWSKYTTVEYDARIPFIAAGPSIKPGGVCKSFVELIDLYPTICDIASIPTPEFVEATSVLPQLRSPKAPGRDAAFTFYDRMKPNAQGISVRTEQYRYTEWRDYDTQELLASELYDHSEGPLAKTNLANRPKMQSVVREHSERIASDPRIRVGK